MNLLTPAGLVLLAALPVLLWLALRPQRSRTLEVGTLLIWRRVAAVASAASRKSRRLDLLLWLALAASAVGALGAARPASVTTAPAPLVAVYVERLAASEDEPGLRQIVERAREAAPDAKLEFWVAGKGRELADGGAVHAINPGPVAAELAQFEAGTREASTRLMFLCAPDTGAVRAGRVLPRVTAFRQGVVFEVGSEGAEILVRSSTGPAPKAEGAILAGAESRGSEVLRRYNATAATVRLGGDLVLERRALAVGVGADWTTPRHKALLAALSPDIGGDKPEVWLGGSDQTPALRINRGKSAALDGCEITFDSQHPLFRELPLGSVELRGGRLLPREPGVRPLATATRGGEIAGDLAQLSDDGRVLSFAGDPFADSSVTAAALLLDNAIGVLVGERPSERPLYRLTQGALPTRRQALAAPFNPEGELKLAARRGEITEWAWWVLVAAALCSLAAVIAAWRTERNL